MAAHKIYRKSNMSDHTQQYPAPSGHPLPPPAWAPAQRSQLEEVQSGPTKKKMNRGKKAGVWTGGILVAFMAIGVVGGDPKTAPTAAPAALTSATTSDDSAADKAAADKAAADKAAADKAAADKAAADKA